MTVTYLNIKSFDEALAFSRTIQENYKFLTVELNEATGKRNEKKGWNVSVASERELGEEDLKQLVRVLFE